MAGLLDFLQTPQGQGLLSGVASYALNARRGTPVNNVGRGLAGGIAGYAQANEQQKAEQEKALRLKLVQDSMKAGISNQTLPGQKPIAQVGGNLYANPNDASAELEQNRFINQSSIPTNYAQMLGPNVQTQGLPRKGGVYGVPLPGAAPQGQPQGMPDYETEMANIMMARESGMPASMSPPLFPPQAEQEMPAIQVQAQREPLPEQATMIGGTPDQTETTFDPRKAAMAMAQSGDLESMRDGWKYLSATSEGVKPQLVDTYDDASGRMVKKWVMPGQADGVQVGYGKPDAEADPYSKDLREALAVMYGVRDPGQATPVQLKAAYAELNAGKDRRAPKTTVSVGGSTILGPDYGKKADTLGAEYLWGQFGEAKNAATAVSAVKDSLSLIERGMFTGRLGPAQESVAAWYQAATGKQMPRLDATQQFKTVIGDIVLPALSNLKGASSDRDFIKIEEYSRGEKTMTESALSSHLNRLLNKYSAQVSSFNSTLDDYTAAEGRPLPGLRKFGDIKGNLVPPEPNPETVKDLPKSTPKGVDSKVWQYMTPEERKLWMK